MDKDLENQLLALWLLELRMNTTHILKEYLEDEELLAWARKNIKQRVHETNPREFEVWYRDSHILYIARELEYHHHIKNYPILQLN